MRLRFFRVWVLSILMFLAGYAPSSLPRSRRMLWANVRSGRSALMTFSKRAIRMERCVATIWDGLRTALPAAALARRM